MMTLEQAMTFALDAFGDSTRKGPLKLPSIWHSCDVATILSLNGITDDETLSLAYLHDVLEDTHTKVIKQEQWPNDDALVCAGTILSPSSSLIEALKQLTNPSHMDQADRKEIELFMATRLGRRAARVRIADKASNARSLMFDRPKDWTDERVAKYRIWATDVVEAAAPQAHAPALVAYALNIIEGNNQ